MATWPCTEYVRPNGLKRQLDLELDAAVVERAAKAGLVVAFEALTPHASVAVYLRRRGVEEEDESTRLVPMQHETIAQAIEAYLAAEGF